MYSAENFEINEREWSTFAFAKSLIVVFTRDSKLVLISIYGRQRGFGY